MIGRYLAIVVMYHACLMQLPWKESSAIYIALEMLKGKFDVWYKSTTIIKHTLSYL